MKWLYKIILNQINWKKLLLLAWRKAYPRLQEKAAQNSYKIDDKVLNLLNKHILTLCTQGDIA